MANAVFNSTETYFSDVSNRPKVPRSLFDLSNIRSFDADYGALIPFYLEDCLPNDDFTISNVIKVQTLPLRNPLFNNIKIFTYYYYVPYYLLWHHFDRFLSGGRDGTYTAELPYFTVHAPEDMIPEDNPQPRDYCLSQYFGPNSLIDYFGFPLLHHDNGLSLEAPSYRVSAFPFAAYQRIYRDYFMSQDHQTNSNVNEWFPEDDFDFSLHDGENFFLNVDDTKTDYSDFMAHGFSGGQNFPWLFNLRYKNFKKDYFTSALFSPQRGPLQAVPITGTFNVDTDSMFASDVPDISSGLPSTLVSLAIDSETGKPSGLLDPKGVNTNYRHNIYGDKPVKEAFSKLSVSAFGNTAGFTISDLRFAVQVQRWLERNMLVKAQYNEFLRIHFNDAPLDERLTKPYYIGGSVQSVKIAEVMQTSESGTTPQGHVSANGFSNDSQFIGKFHSHEYGLIMGIMCIMPDMYYTDGLDKHWSKTSRFSFYFPEFADLEPQAILNKELFTVGDSSIDDDVFGYIGYGDEYRHHRDLAVGSLRNPQQADWFSWILTRDFDVTPTLNSNSFICSNRYNGSATCPPSHFVKENNELVKKYDSMIRHDVFTSGPSVNPFIVQIGIDCKAVRPMPYVSNPVNAEI